MSNHDPNKFAEGMMIPTTEQQKQAAKDAGGYSTNLGKTQRWSMGAKPETPAPVFETTQEEADARKSSTIKVHAGKQSYRVTPGVNDGEAVVSTQHSYSPALDEALVSKELGAIRSHLSNRSLMLSEATDKSLVNIGGVNMELISAAKAGFITRNPDGTYALNTGTPAPTEAPPEEPPVVEHHTDRVRGTIDNLTAHLGGDQRQTEVVVASAIGGIIDGDIGAASLAMSKRTGLDPAISEEAISVVFDETIRSAAKILETQYGVADGLEAFRYVGENLPAARRTSLAHRIYLGDRSAFQEVAALAKKAERHAAYAVKEALRKAGRKQEGEE